MKKNWFYRLLFSYFPIFFSLTSVLILMTFLLLSELSRRETVNANQQFVRHVIQLIDHSLKEIDSALIKEIETDAQLGAFFQGEQSGGQSYFGKYELSKKFTQMSTFDSFVDSVYLYRYVDQMVLSANTFVPLARFGDRAFAEERSAASSLYTLSTRRAYKEFPDQERFPVSVVSIVRSYPLLQGGQGLIVVNIGLARVQKLASELSGGSSYVDIRDRSGQPLLASSGVEGRKGTQLSLLTSDYTGWQFTGGVYDDHTFRVASVFAYIWVGVGLVVVIAGTVWMTYATRRNVRPIEEIMNRIQRYAGQRSGRLAKKGADEFKFIEQALDHLIDESHTYEKMHEEDSVYRRRHFFFELLEGSRDIADAEWRRELERLKLPSAYRSLGVAIYEIDKYSEVAASYSQRDLALLKFVLDCVVKELAEPHAATVWAEWTTPQQLAVLYQSEEAPSLAAQRVAELAEGARGWAEANLDFTITVGVGGCVERLADVPSSAQEAAEALGYKASLGPNRVILPQETGLGEGATYRHLQLVQDFTRCFRTDDAAWRAQLGQLFAEARESRPAREELVQLLNMLIDHLYRDMMELPADIQEAWRTEAVVRLNRLRDTFDFAGDLEAGVTETLTAFAERKSELQQSRSHHTLIREVKAYIDKEYANADLSLSLLCDVFGLNGKYVSRLFKEAFGEKLVDYVVRVRIEQSRRLLTETALPIQHIANAVGYLHDISYIRAFKKVVGTTPGDYRKQHGKSLS